MQSGVDTKLRRGRRLHPGRVNALLVPFAALLLACAGESPPDDPPDDRRSRCVALRDHLANLRVPAEATDAEAHRAAMRDALGEAFVAQCLDQYADDTVACALAAPDSESTALCLTGDDR